MRIELQQNGTWRPMCSSEWRMSSAHLICKELGFPYATGVLLFNDDDDRCMSDVQCDGDEEYLAACQFAKSSPPSGEPSRPVGVTCGNKGTWCITTLWLNY